MSPLELVDDRFEKLASELRAARPVASEELRERVRTLAPPPPRRLELNLRRFVPAAGLAAAAVALTVAVALGVVHGSGSHPVAAENEQGLGAGSVVPTGRAEPGRPAFGLRGPSTERFVEGSCSLQHAAAAL